MNRAVSAKKANKIFYDLVAPLYNDVDGRNDGPPAWLEAIVRDLAAESGGGRLLDLGAGSGLIAKIGAASFRGVCAYDISCEMLKQLDDVRVRKVVGSADGLSFKDAAFDAVTCFSVLHHLDDCRAVLKEVYRVLKDGGIFYSDHDIDRSFRHKWIFRILKIFSDSGRRYMQSNPAVTKELHDAAECRAGEGIDSGEMESVLREAGFRRVTAQYHWKVGLSRRGVFLPSGRDHRRTQAPVVSFVAVK